MRTLAGLLLIAAPSALPAAGPRSRTFLFTYSTTISGLPPGLTAHVWLPVPSSRDEQDVTIVRRTVDAPTPSRGEIGSEAQYGNRVLHVPVATGRGGPVKVEVVYRVTRKELKGPARDAEDMARIARYLQADVMVPLDGKPLSLIKDKKLPDDPMAKARALYDLVDGHMKYDKSRPGWGRGDAAWACDSRFGNCTDFHSLFISLARSQQIPAKFEIGFSIPEKRGQGDITGYHCWAKFRPSDKGWVGVDISEADKNPRMKEYYFGNLTEDRVAFSTGRDLVLAPPQKGKPLNFFVFPYVEVDGKPHPAEQIKNRFGYEDVR